jgi:hypothetical protein
MGDLVYDGDPDLFDDLLMSVRDRQDRVPEDQDVIRQPGVELPSFRKWNA